MLLTVPGGLNLYKTASECLVCCEDCSDVDVLDLLFNVLTKSSDIGQVQYVSVLSIFLTILVD